MPSNKRKAKGVAAPSISNFMPKGRGSKSRFAPKSAVKQVRPIKQVGRALDGTTRRAKGTKNMLKLPNAPKVAGGLGNVRQR